MTDRPVPFTAEEIAELRRDFTDELLPLRLLDVAEDHARIYGYCNDAAEIERALRAQLDVAEQREREQRHETVRGRE